MYCVAAGKVLLTFAEQPNHKIEALQFIQLQFLNVRLGIPSSRPDDRAPIDRINIRILETMISGIPLVLGLGTRM